eukprot:gene19491-biopygen32662
MALTYKYIIYQISAARRRRRTSAAARLTPPPHPVQRLGRSPAELAWDCPPLYADTTGGEHARHAIPPHAAPAPAAPPTAPAPCAALALAPCAPNESTATSSSSTSSSTSVMGRGSRRGASRSYASPPTLIRGTHLPTLYKRAQEALDRLSRWEVAHQARVSLDKTTATVFVPSRTALPVERRPKLWYPDQSAPPPFTGVKRAIAYEAHPKLLGLTYDERLTFQTHVADLRPKIQRRAKTLGALSGTSWGCNIRELRALHLSYVQSKTEYGLAAYGPFATEHTLHPLETEQYHAACKISGCPKSTRRQVALLEAGLESVAQRVDHKS